MGIEQVVEKLLGRQSLSADEAQGALEAILAGEISHVQTAAFLIALRAKGETPEELAALASVLRRHAAPFPPQPQSLDTCGTGGDCSGTFNISTAAAFAAAAMGIPVVKHGNRSVSSACGSADVLTALGVKIDVPAERVLKSLRECGFAFFFAPAWHPAMKRVAPVRVDLKVRTVFNLLGPLCNPARAEHQLMGVCTPELAVRMVQTLRTLGMRRAMVVCGEDGLDEISPCARTRLWMLTDGAVREGSVRPEDAGLRPCSRIEIAAGNPDESARKLREALAGRGDGALTAVLLNAAGAAMVAGRAASWAEGVALAREAIASGKAASLLDKVVAVSQEST